IKYISNRGNEIEEYESAKITGPTEAWVQLSVSSTVPDGAETAIFGFIQVGNDDSTGKVYFDDAYVEVIPQGYTPPPKNPFQKPQSTGPVQISGRTLLVNGEPFKIKGVGYQPTPIGAVPWEYDFFSDPDIYNRDLPILREMNVNAIRTYGVVSSTGFLDACYNDGVDPIYVVMGYYIPTEIDEIPIDLSNDTVREGIKDGFRTYVSTYKTHPAVLMWSPGNETELVYEGRDRDLFTLLNELAEVAYIEELRDVEGTPYHPVTAAIENIEEIDDNALFTTDDDMDYIDVWGGNVYEGITFDDMFDDFLHRSQKPFWVSEYGIDAYHVTSYHFDRVSGRHVVDTGDVNEDEQADWTAALTVEIMLSDVPIGGMVFAYSDEWWKEGEPSVHNRSGSARDPRVDEWVFPDRFQNEEYWGVVEVAIDGTWETPDGVDDIRKRQVYYVLRGLFDADDAWILNMTEMDWYENIASYYSTGAAVSQMILNYIREGADEPTLTQDEIYEYARNPLPYDGTELNADEVDKALGHFDPYDYLVSNWADGYDSLPGGNPYQGYNYTVHTYDPSEPDAMNEYIRDICHWMAYTVTQGNWWDPDGELVARPNTPAAVPIYGTYDHWVAVKGFVASENPVPDPRGNPWAGPDFTVYGLWMKDPLVTGIGQNTYKTAEECESTYFQPLATGDAYDGLLLQIAEPPMISSNYRFEITGKAEIKKHTQDLANLEFVGVMAETGSYEDTDQVMAMSLSTSSLEINESTIKKQSWRDLVDPYLLTDSEAVAAFQGTEMGESILVNRIDIGGSNYYLVPFNRLIEGESLASAVIVLDANGGYFKEASWTTEPEKFLKVDKKRAIKLAMKRQPVFIYTTKYTSYTQTIEAELIWKPNGYSSSPYKPYWKVNINGRIWYVTQEGEVISGGSVLIKPAIELY
ncbi:MAG: glycoside hydrolase family 2 TIM barrel-domain containing protein, partial [Candidatus Brocadiales bacterium]